MSKDFASRELNTAKRMFSGCSSLKELDCSNFDFSRVDSFEYFLWNCYSLTNIKFPIRTVGKYNTIAESFKGMFYLCHSLKEIDITWLKKNEKKKFIIGDQRNTTILTYKEYKEYMSFMFCRCASLTNIKYSKNFFNGVSAENKKDICYGCTHLNNNLIKDITK